MSVETEQNRTIQMKMTFKYHQVQLPDHFRANQPQRILMRELPKWFINMSGMHFYVGISDEANKNYINVVDIIVMILLLKYKSKFSSQSCCGKATRILNIVL